MTEAIVVALITAGASIICQVILSRKSSIERDITEAKRQQSIDDQLVAIKTRLDEHNGYAKKFADLSGDIQNMATAIALLQKDVQNLGKDGN